jgi:hypothetical protein
MAQPTRLKLLRRARRSLGDGMRAVGAGNIAESDEISLRNRQLTSRTLPSPAPASMLADA